MSVLYGSTRQTYYIDLQYRVSLAHGRRRRRRRRRFAPRTGRGGGGCWLYSLCRTVVTGRQPSLAVLSICLFRGHPGVACDMQPKCVFIYVRTFSVVCLVVVLLRVFVLNYQPDELRSITHRCFFMARAFFGGVPSFPPAVLCRRASSSSCCSCTSPSCTTSSTWCPARTGFTGGSTSWQTTSRYPPTYYPRLTSLPSPCFERSPLLFAFFFVVSS